MRKHLILSAAAALVVGGNALAAEGVSYNFVQGGLAVASLSSNGDSEDGIGIGISGEAEIWEFLYGFVDISNVTYKPDGADLTFAPASLGVGAHMPLGPVDAFAGLSMERVKVKVDPDGPGSSFSNSDSGVGLTAGVRGMLGENVQWSGSLKYRDLDDLDSALGLSISGHYYFRPTMAAGVTLTRTDYRSGGPNETSALFTFRYDFSSMR
jgi:hypothetical protein